MDATEERQIDVSIGIDAEWSLIDFLRFRGANLNLVARSQDVIRANGIGGELLDGRLSVLRSGNGRAGLRLLIISLRRLGREQAGLAAPELEFRPPGSTPEQGAPRGSKSRDL